MSNTIATGTERLRVAWQVRAGVVPGVPMEELERKWFLTSEVFYAEQEMTEEEFKAAHPDGKSTFATFRDDAYEYAKSLNEPRALNWVEVTWIWY
jgi:hypothetical protein